MGFRPRARDHRLDPPDDGGDRASRATSDGDASAEGHVLPPGDDVADGFGTAAASVEGERLAIEILPALVGFVGNRDKDEAVDPEKDFESTFSLFE
ncbi:MAG: hypothetical protein RMJ04_08290 [Geminicoccaceae bacterium]|nr:hypothetical protein [Geminicoccaceae bacterium]